MAINVNINTSTVGASIMNAADPSAIRWIRVNADNTITYRTAAETLSDIGAQGSITLTTTGTSGAATLIANTLNIPQYQAAGTYVTAVSVASSNGFAGSSSGGATPTITLTTSVTGILQGNGTAISAATTTGSGAVVLGTSPTITTGITAGSSAGLSLIASGSSTCFLIGAGGGQNNTAYGGLKLDYGTASTVVYLDASKNLISLANGTGVLTNNGAGVLSWASASSGITINSTAISGGGANRILFENSSNQVSESATDFYFQSASPYAHIFASGRTGTISGVNNTAFGYYAAKALTTGTNGTYIGYNAGAASIAQTNCTYVGANAGAISTGSYNTFIGSDVASSTSTGSDNVSVGYRSAYGMGSGSRNTIIGRVAGFQSENTVDAVFIGYFSGYSTGAGANYSIFIGSNPSAFGQSGASNIAIGYSVTPTATHQGILGSNDANGYISDWYYNSPTHTAPYSVTLNASGGSGSNVAGANLTLASGKATGNAASGNKKSQTSVKRSSGSTLQSLTDRQAIIGKYVDLTESSATTFGTLALTTSGTIAGGVIVYTVEANDGTDYQSLTGTAPYSVVNKAGTLTLTLGTDTQISACSSGTLTGTLTVAASGTSLQWQMNAVSSLSQTVLRISFQVLNNFGVATILPA